MTEQHTQGRLTLDAARSPYTAHYLRATRP